MNHKSFVNNISAADRKKLYRLSNWPSLFHLGLHATVIVLMAVYIGLELPGWPLFLLPQGVAIVFLFTLQHECTHKTAFRTPWINEAIGWLSGFLIFQPFGWFRAFHREHHRHTNDPERDPELVSNAKPSTKKQLLLHLSTVGYWKQKIQLLLVNAMGDVRGGYIRESTYGSIKTEARMMVFTYALVAVYSLAFSTIFLWLWIIPLLLGFPVLRLYLLAEHGQCPEVNDTFANTRTVYCNRLIRFISWNMPYHVEHHLLPAVPYHRLPEVHRKTHTHLQNTNCGYVEFALKYITKCQ